MRRSLQRVLCLLLLAIVPAGCAQRGPDALADGGDAGPHGDGPAGLWPGIDLDDTGWLRVGIAQSFPGHVTSGDELRLFLRQAETQDIKAVTVMASRAELAPDDIRLLGLIPGIASLDIVKDAMDDRRGMLIDDAVLQACANVASLTELSLTAGGFGALGVGYLGRLPNLTRLHIAGPLDDEAAMQLQSLQRLRSLQLTDCSVTVRSLRALSACRGLRRLALRGEFVTDGLSPCFREFPRLSYLRLQDTRLTDRGLRELARCAQLVSLAIEGSAIKGTSFADLQTAGSLRYLHIGAAQVRPDALGRAQWPPDLESLSLADNPLTVDAVLAFPLPPKLKILDVRGIIVQPEEAAKLGARIEAVGARLMWGAGDEHLDTD